jgi:serine protease Do
MNRKQIIPLTLGLFFSLCLVGTQAQEAPKAKERKEIIIREKDGKDEKMTIVVDGDKITINGKPLAEYDGDNIIIRKKGVERMAKPYAYATPGIPRQPRTPFAPMPPMGPDGWNFSFEEFDFPELAGSPRAQLGVVSEKDSKGAKLTEVMPETAAARAGLKEGDIITAVDGKKVDGPESLSELIRAKKPEEESSVTYLRDKKSKTVKVKLGKASGSAPKMFRFEAPRMERELEEQFRDLDRQYRSRDNQMKELEKQFRAMDKENFRFDKEREFSGNRPKLGIRIEDMEEAKGVKVIDVEAGSAAEQAGFKNGDILTYIDDKKITNTDQAREALRANREKSTYPVTVLRNGQPFNMNIKIPRELKKADL